MIKLRRMLQLRLEGQRGMIYREDEELYGPYSGQLIAATSS